MSEDEVERLVRQAQGGDPDAAGELLRRRFETEDVFQSAVAVFPKGLSGLHFQGEKAFVAWPPRWRSDACWARSASIGPPDATSGGRFAVENAGAVSAGLTSVLALAQVARQPDGDCEAALTALEEAGEAGNSPEVRNDLWKTTGNAEHLAEAKRLLDSLVEHAPEEYRESMLKNVPLNREIMEAWAEHGQGDAR